MSKDEVKREYKEMEGDPQVKGKRKQLHQEMLSQNALGNVRKAKVLVTNPTHYAVALDYEKDRTPLPVILAKGEGFLAQRMIRVAQEEGIPIMRNVPLARSLFENGTENAYIPQGSHWPGGRSTALGAVPPAAMTNAQETNVKQEPLSEQAFLDTLINLCDDLAWGRPASEDRLFALTKEGAGPKNYVRLAEAFGMMLVKVESREYHRSQLIADLKTRNAELEEAHRLLAERNTHLMRTIQENYQTKKIVGQCEAMRKVIQLALTIARRPINTLILGPTGAGKEVIAKAIHFNSPRREGPFVAVNCTANPPTRCLKARCSASKKASPRASTRVSSG